MSGNVYSLNHVPAACLPINGLYQTAVGSGHYKYGQCLSKNLLSLLSTESRAKQRQPSQPSPPHHTRSSRLRRLQKNNLHLPTPTSSPTRLLHLSYRPRWSPRRPLQKRAECHPQVRKQCLHLRCFYSKTCRARQSPHSFQRPT